MFRDSDANGAGGLLAELGSHHLDVANWILGEMPERVIGNGGIDFYRDGRETFDNVQAIYTYPSGAAGNEHRPDSPRRA